MKVSIAKHGYTKIEALLVIAILGMLAGLLLPLLERNRAREGSRFTCRANLHNLGVAMWQWRGDHGDSFRYPADQTSDVPTSQVLGLIWAEGYVDSPHFYCCPSIPWEESDPPEAILGGMRGSSPVPAAQIVGTSYFFDEYRIDDNSSPLRAVLADGIERCTSDGPQAANHAEGANVLWADLSSQWVSKESPDVRWIKPAACVGVGGEEGYAATGGPWVRYGRIPNPRLDEDGIKGDRDDIYECEGRGPDDWSVDPDSPVNWTLDPAGADEFFSLSPAARFSGQWADQPPGLSKTDAALAGGAITHNGSWRNKTGWYAEGDNRKYSGWTWGIPEEHEDEVR